MADHDRRIFEDPRRSLEQYLAELVDRFDALPLQDRGRADLARRIREVEAEIDARSTL